LTAAALVHAAIRRCVRCPALVKCRSQVVPGHGAVPARIAFVGLAPGRLGADRTGIPFSGDRSGELLRGMIARAGLRRLFITNRFDATRATPAAAIAIRGAREIANCSGHLAAELALVRPRVVVCLGAVAWRELARSAAPFRPRSGAVLDSGDALLYPMYHPAYVVRGAYTPSAYARDFRRLARVCNRA
jgi:DNA polymerase